VYREHIDKNVGCVVKGPNADDVERRSSYIYSRLFTLLIRFESSHLLM
jgi:hypothetical protein